MSTEATDKNFYDKLTLGVVKSLEKRHGVCDINLDQGPPVQRTAIAQWEQKHACMMPEDLKSFYLTNNGFTLKWCVKLNDTRIPVGKMEVNKLGVLSRIGGSAMGGPSLTELDMDYEEEEDNRVECSSPKFDHRSRIFELDPCDGYGKVCLVYNNTKPGIPASKAEVWFMDRALQFHFMADNFLSFYRLLLLHLGLPQWQYAFTDIGLSPQAKQWFHMYAPERLDLMHKTLSNHDNDKATVTTSPLDLGRVFKGKSDKRKTTNAQSTSIKKKLVPGATLVKSGNTSLGRVSGTSSQVSKASK